MSYPTWSSLRGEVFSPLCHISISIPTPISWNPYPRGSSIFFIHGIFGLGSFLWYLEAKRTNNSIFKIARVKQCSINVLTTQ